MVLWPKMVFFQKSHFFCLLYGEKNHFCNKKRKNGFLPKIHFGSKPFFMSSGPKKKSFFGARTLVQPLLCVMTCASLCSSIFADYSMPPSFICCQLHFSFRLFPPSSFNAFLIVPLCRSKRENGQHRHAANTCGYTGRVARRAWYHTLRSHLL